MPNFSPEQDLVKSGTIREFLKDGKLPQIIKKTVTNCIK